MNIHDEHVWQARSQHSTSDGLVTYQQCACGQWRVTVADGGSPVLTTDGDRAA